MSIPSSILVVKDGPAIAELVAVNLQHVGHYPTRAYNAKQTLSLMSDVLPDLILLDWMLLGKPGTVSAKELRANERMRQISITMLTARDEEQNKTMGLGSGADDYATKPFSLKELPARIKAVLHRRTSQLTGDVVVINGLELDPATHRVTTMDTEAENSTRLDFGPTELRLPHFLMTYPKCMYSRSQLLDQVWGDHVFVEECMVDTHIKRLRTALAPDGYSNIIEIVRGSGYRLVRSPR